MERSLPALYGRINAEHLAQLTGAHITTARRWKRLLRAPAWLERLVRLVIEGELGEIHAAWRGWSIRQGELISPEGWRYTPGQLRAQPFMVQQLAMYRARVRLPSQADWISGELEPLPGALVRDAWPRAPGDVVNLR